MFFFCLLGCFVGSEDSAQVKSPSFLNFAQFRFSDLSTDPLLSHQPAEVECLMSSFLMEQGGLEISTNSCNYAAIEFDAQHPLKAGDVLDVFAFHKGLWAPEPSTAHLAILIKDEIFWQTTATIPGDSEFFYYDAPITSDIEEGDPIHVHLHNHGINDWIIMHIQPKDMDTIQAE